MLSQLSSNDKLALVAALLVETTALLALGDAWGMIMVVPLLASIGVLLILLLPWLASSAKLPAPKGISILALGVAAVVGTAISTIQNFDFIREEISDFETLIFLLGLFFAIGLAYAGWMAFRAEAGPAVPAAAASPVAPAAAPAAEPTPPPETPAT